MKKTNPSKWFFSSLTFLTINLNWNGCLAFFFDNLDDTLSETVEDIATEKVATVLIFLLLMSVSTATSIRDMILHVHYEKGENLCAIYNTRKTDSMAYMSPECLYLPGCTVCCFKCVCLYSGVTRLTYSTAFLFSVLGSKQPQTTEFQVRMKFHLTIFCWIPASTSV